MGQLIRIIFLILSSLLLIKVSVAQQVKEVLSKVEQNIEKAHLISFHSEHTNINPTVEDSISKSSATIWVQKVPSDSIFGAYFHLEGKEGDEKFEYFYDGQNSYEIHHKDKQVTIFYPHNYPNNRSNPAKARTALLPFNRLLIDDNFTKTLLRDHPNTSIHQNAEQTKWIITLEYPETDEVQQATDILEINKSTYRLDRITQLTKWRGSKYKRKFIFSDYKLNDPSISENIFITKHYKEYSQKVFERKSTTTSDSHAELIDNTAPGFSFTSFSGKDITLNNLKGKVILLDFWESWCGYCIMAMPKLNNLQRQFENNFTVIGIVTENKEPVRKLIKNNGLIYPNIYANQEVLEDYNVSARPTYVLIDQEGKITSISTGNIDAVKPKIYQLLN